MIISLPSVVVAVHACACSRLILSLQCYLTRPDTEQYLQAVTSPSLPLTNQKKQERFLITNSTEEDSLDVPPADKVDISWLETLLR